MAKVTLTGGTGFIGKRVQQLLNKDGHTVTVLKRPECDLLDKDSVASALPTCDILIHLASRAKVGESIEHPSLHLEQNPLMLLNLLDSLQSRNEKPLVILASTDRQYALHEGEIDEDATSFPIEPYTASKMICETILRCYAHRNESPFIILRIDSVYGPGQPEAMFISDVIKKCFVSENITVGNLDTTKNFIFVDDVARAFVAAVNAPKNAHNAVYNVTGDHATLTEVLERILSIIKKETGREISMTSDPSVAKRSRHEVKAFRCNPQRIKENLHWEKQTSLEQGLQQTVRYFQSHDA